MLGEPVSYERIPYFFSDQNRIGLEHSGYAAEWDEVVFRGERGSGAFVAFWLSDGRLVADANVNIWDVNEHVQALIRSRSPRRPRRADGSGHPLDSLVGSISTGLLSFAPQGA
jgi:3-phenylpropionate/trans-cinnamate dioxygenase ferredoxin reductase component